uniref:Uncharacterized protein n=1 Tax=Cacopsylla melanoneura TaxID=428564 RepID=A0A8D8Q7Z1_9HEMI
MFLLTGHCQSAPQVFFDVGFPHQFLSVQILFDSKLETAVPGCESSGMSPIPVCLVSKVVHPDLALRHYQHAQTLDVRRTEGLRQIRRHGSRAQEQEHVVQKFGR